MYIQSHRIHRDTAVQQIPIDKKSTIVYEATTLKVNSKYVVVILINACPHNY